MTSFNFKSSAGTDLVSTNSNAMFAFTSGAATSQATTRFLNVGGQSFNTTTAEADAQIKVNQSVTASNIIFYVTTNTVTAASTGKLRINSVDGNLAISITASTTGNFEDTTHTDSLVSTDLICAAITAGTGGTSITATYVTMLIIGPATPSGATPTPQLLMLMGIGT